MSSKQDQGQQILITGAELTELKRHTWAMGEAFGLDRKIENYQGKRPLTLYPYDLDCLLDVLALALEDENEYPDRSAPGYLALENLNKRLRQGPDTAEKTAEAPPASAKAKGKANASSPSRDQGSVYQLKVALADIKPPVWRRVEVENCTLMELHNVIQAAMGWDGSHLWAFTVAGEQYGDDPDGELEMIGADKLDLARMVKDGVKKFRYVYDFGDNWAHTIQIEKVLEGDAKVKYPRCVKGSRACPPEDCGGPWGYAGLLQALADPKHPQHKEMKQWMARKFDPEAFDAEAINKRLAKPR